jgi:nitrogen-specific signal transduction histidine kinase
VAEHAIVHELANQLTVIRGAAELLRRSVVLPDDLSRDLQTLVEATDCAMRLVKQLNGPSWD